MKILIQILLTVYLGLAPIYWLPGIPFELLGTFKIGLFLLASGLTFLSLTVSNRFGFPRGMLGPAGLALGFLSVLASLLQSEPTLAFVAVKDYVLVFATLWIFFLLGHLGVDARRTLIGASLIVAAACFPVATSRYLGAPDFAGPSQFVANHLWISGFGSLRTGWSNGTALYVGPLLLLLRKENKFIIHLIAAAGIGAILASQLAVAGRAGIIASAIIIAIGLSSRGKRKILVLMASCVVLIVVTNINAFYAQMRITREDEAAHRADDLNTISAGRLQGDAIGFQSALESPLLGHGLQKATIGTTEIHNLWIRMAMESGFLAPIVLLIVALRILNTSRRLVMKSAHEDAQLSARVYLGVIAAGLFMSMVEPRMILGTFQISVMWWAFAGVCAYQLQYANPSTQPKPDSVSRKSLFNLLAA